MTFEPWDTLVPGDVVIDNTTGLRMTFDKVVSNLPNPIVAMAWFERQTLRTGHFRRSQVVLDNIGEVLFDRDFKSKRIPLSPRHMSKGLRHMPDLYPEAAHRVMIDHQKYRMYGRMTDHHDFFADTTGRWMFLWFQREIATYAFFEDVTDAVTFKLLIV